MHVHLLPDVFLQFLLEQSWGMDVQTRHRRKHQTVIVINRSYVCEFNGRRVYAGLCGSWVSCFTRNQVHVWNWNKIISAAERVLKLFQNYFSDIEHVGKYSWAAISLLNICEMILIPMKHCISIISQATTSSFRSENVTRKDQEIRAYERNLKLQADPHTVTIIGTACFASLRTNCSTAHLLAE